MKRNVIEIDGAAISSVTDLCRQVARVVSGPKSGYGSSIEDAMDELKRFASESGTLRVIVANSAILRQTFGRDATTDYLSHRYGGSLSTVREEALKELHDSVLDESPTLYERLVSGLEQAQGIELELA